MSPIIQTDALSVDYGSARALFDVSISVNPGESVALLGSNGAGKSTLGKALAGLVQPSSGTVTFDGADITDLPAHKVSRLDLAYLPEGRGIFPGLSVLDNLRMSLRRSGTRQSLEARVEAAMDLFPILGQRRQQLAGTLSR
jgi:branched-chain amino acid transport system ATP-binding protein